MKGYPKKIKHVGLGRGRDEWAKIRLQDANERIPSVYKNLGGPRLERIKPFRKKLQKLTRKRRRGRNRLM